MRLLFFVQKNSVFRALRSGLKNRWSLRIVPWNVHKHGLVRMLVYIFVPQFWICSAKALNQHPNFLANSGLLEPCKRRY